MEKSVYNYHQSTNETLVTEIQRTIVHMHHRLNFIVVYLEHPLKNRCCRWRGNRWKHTSLLSWTIYYTMFVTWQLKWL